MARKQMIKIDPTIVLSEMTDLERNFYEFQDLRRTFNGWVLTLDEIEFRDLMIDFKLFKGKTSPAPPKYKILEYIHDGILRFDNAEFTEDLVMKGDHLKKISLCKDGYMSYEIADEDKDWKFKITPLGQQLANDIHRKKQGR